LKQPRDRQPKATRGARSQPDQAGRISAVYVIKIGDRHKIGLSVNPEQRVAGMQLPERPQFVLIFRCKGAADLEQALHRKYAEFRLHGEWFKLERPQLIEIARVCEAWKKEVE
jgi:hypothetical protein